LEPTLASALKKNAAKAEAATTERAAATITFFHFNLTRK